MLAMTTLEKLEKIVEKQIAEDCFAGKVTIAHFISPAGHPMERAGVIARCLSRCLIFLPMVGSCLRRRCIHLKW